MSNLVSYKINIYIYIHIYTHTYIYVQCQTLFFLYCSSITVVSHFSLLLSPVPPPHHSPLSLSIPTPLSMSMSPLYTFLDLPRPLFSCYLPPRPALVTISLFFISVSLGLFCLFVSLIRFHLQVRSYGICLSPPGLFHLA